MDEKGLLEVGLRGSNDWKRSAIGMDDLAKLIGPCGRSFQCGVGEFAERLQEEDAVVGDRRICQRKRLAVLLSCSVVRSIEEDVGIECVAAVSAHRSEEHTPEPQS